MSDLGLLIDFGSTFTKVMAVDLSRGAVLGRAQAPTTVETNIVEGYRNALSQVMIAGRRLSGADIAGARRLASSSAAGGLGIVAVGLVPELTLEAARKAALGAGAKLIGSFGHELDERAIAEIGNSACDLVLLAGGVDGGNKKGILHNARKLAGSTIAAPVILAGNRFASEEARQILEAAGKQVHVSENVLPALDRLSVESARAAIREVFISRIVKAKGFLEAQDIVGTEFVPTPRATLQAASVLAQGTRGEAGLGPLVVVEIGGATINVHSIGEAANPELNAVKRGIPEPHEKRTVEGDLGIRINASTILETLGSDHVRGFLPTAMADGEISGRIDSYTACHATLPATGEDLAFDVALASAAADVALDRHAGRLSQVWTGGERPVNVCEGKDLSLVGTMIGTGGIFAHNRNAPEILRNLVSSRRTPGSLRPVSPRLLCDTGYTMYGVGLLAGESPELAFRLARHQFLEARD